MQRRYPRSLSPIQRRPVRAPSTAGNAIQEQYLGELPEEFLSERALRDPIMSPMIREFAPGTSPLIGPDPNIPIPKPANAYKSVVYPFNAPLQSAKVVPANPYRAYLLIQNNDGGGNPIFVNFGADARFNNSIVVVDGGNFVFEGGAAGGVFCPQEDVYVLGSGGLCIFMEGISVIL